ncbi:MAG: ArsR family transcriptional regulator [Ignavibacteria bacterium]|nr:ArsR family transcriptional regulator [Ignavibacteria bacterium]
MIDSLITSKTRVKLLLKFFLNSKATSYLRNLESEFGESTNAIRIELNRFEKAGLLKSSRTGNKKYFRANTKHPFFPEINKIIRKYTGLEEIIERVTKNIGDIKKVYACGDIAKGRDTKIIDLIFVGDNIDTTYLNKIICKAEKLIRRKINYKIFDNGDPVISKHKLNKKDTLLLWEA